LPASHVGAGDVDKLEERILHILLYCTVLCCTVQLHKVADTISKTIDLIYYRPHP
jgi:hypothetical protein